jgi:hypothetical protein
VKIDSRILYSRQSEIRCFNRFYEAQSLNLWKSGLIPARDCTRAGVSAKNPNRLWD